MLLTRYRPLDEFRDYRTRMNSLLSEFDHKTSSLSDFTPVVSTREGEFAYHVDVDLPGVKKGDIKIDVHDNILTISGERSSKDEKKEGDYHRIETSFGKFERSFTLPKSSDAENISASSKDGVLEVVVPKLKGKDKKMQSIKVK